VHDFERQDSRQTLEQGIAEYHAKNPGLAACRDPSSEATAFFRCHDAVHVVFGCGNGLEDEAVVKLSNVFGTSGRFATLRGYRLHESRQIYRTLAVGEIFRVACAAFVLVPRTLWRCARMSRKWPWDGYDQYLPMPLSEIRRSFGIRVSHG
jgi:hypothetical protein